MRFRLREDLNTLKSLHMLKNESLFEVHKAERRERILAAARRLIARRGVEGLTLRDLAAEAVVSVPTVYNLVGGKQAVLSALLAETFARVAGRLEAARADGMVDRAMALCAAGWTELLEEPGYFRGLVRSFLVSEESAPVRQEIDEANVRLMTALLTAGRADGELASWCDPEALARTLWAQYVVCMIGWASNELTDEELPACATYGMCLMLLGVARGAAAHKLQKLVRASQPDARAERAHAKGART
jgi:AcrR family transcriptional regulator